jgi:hypothetical protein
LLLAGGAAGTPPGAGIDHGRAVGAHQPAARPPQFVVEAGLDLEHGFWNLVANGASFQSLGRRPTRPGRQLIATYRMELNQVEGVVNAQVQAWRAGRPTPLAPELEAMLRRWRALSPGQALVVEWPTRRLPRLSPHVRRGPIRPRRLHG